MTDANAVPCRGMLRGEDSIRHEVQRLDMASYIPMRQRRVGY